MKPSEIIQQIDYLNKEINSLIEQLVSEKENPQVMDIDLLNQKLIGIYDLSLKLRYKINLGEVEIASEESDLEYFHFEPGTSKFIIDTEEKPETQPAVEEIIEESVEEIPQEPEPEPEPEPEKIEKLTKEEVVREIVEEILAETNEETATPSEEIIIAEEKAIEQTEVPDPAIELIEEDTEPELSEKTIDESEQIGTPYWSVETGWTKPIEENTEPRAVEEIVPEPEPIQSQNKSAETEAKPEGKEKKPIFESISKHERSLNEMMAENKEKSVINETQNQAFTDFKSAITLNLKISFIRELFHGNEKDYKKMIDFLTRCENFSEARLYMQGEKEKHPEWESKQDLLNHLQELINRKFL